MYRNSTRILQKNLQKIHKKSTMKSPIISIKNPQNKCTKNLPKFYKKNLPRIHKNIYKKYMQKIYKVFYKKSTKISDLQGHIAPLAK